MLTFRTLLLASLAAVFSASGVASAEGEGARSLSLGEALRLGEANIPGLVRGRAEQQLVEARRAGASLWLTQNPYASVLVGQRQEKSAAGVASGIQYQIHIEQALEIAGQRWARLAAVGKQIDVAKAQTDFARVEARALLQTAYLQSALAAQRVAVSKSREELAERLLVSARTRLELGATGELETNLAQIEVGRVRGDRVQAEVAQEAHLTLLRVLCGIPPAMPLQLQFSQAELPTLSPEHAQVDSLQALAASERADLRAVRRQEEALVSESKRLRRDAVPSLVVALDFQRDLPGQEFIGGTVGLTLPAFSRNQGPLAQVAASENLRKSEERLLRMRIAGEVALAHRKLELLRKQVLEFQQNALPPAERNIDLLRRGWQAGKFDLFRVIVASRELADTRLRLLDLIESLWVAAIELERSVGAPLISGGLS